VLDLIGDRLDERRQALPRVGEAADILLTGMQVTVHNALISALVNSSAPIVLQGGAGLGKTTVLAAALASVSDPLVQIVRLDGADGGMDESFRTLFGKKRQGHRWYGMAERRPERRIVLVADQAERLDPGAFAYLDLLARMPGKEALLQTLIVGRPACWEQFDGMVGERLSQALPVHLTLPPLSEQDAWDLFHHRVSSAHPLRSSRRLVTALLERSEGRPGRFDQVLRMAVATGLLPGVCGLPA